tara:strand:+ start:2894 stop:3697 length:804 start_codon:yes stop_codon:yes gene_type:complete
MNKKFIAGGCSFTFGHELSDDDNGKHPSKKTWAYGLYQNSDCDQYICTANPGSGNSGIARRIFKQVANNDVNDIGCVVAMWSFNSRYDWAMPRHHKLEDTRWTSISPWDIDSKQAEVFEKLENSEGQQEQWLRTHKRYTETGVKDFAEAIYKYAANEYHETYLSWKSIIWLQNILEKKQIPYLFTLADNSLFYKNFDHHKNQDTFMDCLHKEIDLTKWFKFGDRMMGFNQWATLEDYEYGTTHPLDKAHEDAIILMLPTFNKLIGGK